MRPALLPGFVRSLCLTLCFIAPAHAGLAPVPLILTVGNTANCDHNTIQNAINAAQAAGNTIIRISNNVGHTNQALTITNKNIELRGGYPGCDLAPSDPDARTTIRGNGGDSVLIIDAVGNPRTVILRNLVIREGGSSDVLTERGGGVRIQGESLVEIRNSRISDNQSHDGGGIHIQGSDAELVLDDGTIIGEASGVPGNRAVDNGITDGRGGGLTCSGADVDIIDARFRLNTSDENGGGMYANACVVRISPRAAFVEGENGANGFVTFFENQAGRDGGAIYAVNGNVLWFAFDGSSFAGRATGNRAENSGGAFFLTGNAMSFATFWVRLEGNSATNNGGAVWVGDDASFTFGPSSTMSCSYATCPAIVESGLDNASPVIRGGAIYVAGDANVAVVRSIIARNVALGASAISASGDAFLILRHVLVHQNFLSGNDNLGSPIEVLAGADADLIHVTMANNARPGGVLVQPPLSSLAVAGASSSIEVRNSVFTDDGDVTLRNFPLDPAGVSGSCSLSHEDSTLPGLVIGEPAYSDPAGDAPDFSLGIGSDGIDRCANVEIFPLSPLPDLRGRERPFDVLSIPNDAGTWDMGAFESWILTSADIFEDGFEDEVPFNF
jgi:predicted outer membrane repeat protein